MSCNYFLNVLLIVLMGCQLSAQSDHHFLRKGNADYEKEEYQAAEENYRRALATAPGAKTAPKSTYNLGASIYQQSEELTGDQATGRFEEAAKQFETAAGFMAGTPQQADSWYNAGNAHLKRAMSQQKPEEQMESLQKSIESYKRTLRQNPRDLDAKNNLAIAQQKLKKLQQEQQQNQQNQQDNKDDKKKDQNKDQQNKDQQNKDQQNKDQQKKQEQQEQQQKDQQKPQERQDKKPQEMNKEEAERLLQILENEDRKAQEKLLRAKSIQKKKTDKDW